MHTLFRISYVTALAATLSAGCGPRMTPEQHLDQHEATFREAIRLFQKIPKDAHPRVAKWLKPDGEVCASYKVLTPDECRTLRDALKTTGVYSMARENPDGIYFTEDNGWNASFGPRFGLAYCETPPCTISGGQHIRGPWYTWWMDG